MNQIDILSIDHEKTLLIDIRPSEEFVMGFIPESMHLPLAKIEKNVGLLNEKDMSWVLIGNEEEAKEAFIILASLFPKVSISFAKDAISTWNEAGKSLDMIIQIEADEYAMDAQFDEKIMLVDVRTERDYEELHAEDAVSMPLQSMSDLFNIASVDDDTNVYLHCGGGSSAIIAASLFKKQGFHSLRVIEGGIRSMKQEDRINLIAKKKEKE